MEGLDLRAVRGATRTQAEACNRGATKKYPEDRPSLRVGLFCPASMLLGAYIAQAMLASRALNLAKLAPTIVQLFSERYTR